MCQGKFSSLKVLEGHCLKNHSPNYGQAMCEGCNQVVYKNRLAEHIRSAHCHNGEAAANQQMVVQRIAPAKPQAALVPLKPMVKSLISSKPLGIIHI